MVDALVRTGIDRHFPTEVQNVLDATYRSWEQEEEDIFLDVPTCAMAFRLLPANGYEVSPGPLAQFETEDNYLSSLAGHLNDMNAVLELHRASEVMTRSDESVLKKINAWSRPFLKRCYVDDHVHLDNLKLRIRQEVDDVLKFPFYASLERLENKRYINIYGSGNSKILKTSYNCTIIDNKEIRKLAAEDFNSNQLYLREEFRYFERWVPENRLDEPRFVRQGVWHFTAVTIFVSPELSDARLAWAKSAMLVLVVDDLFDVTGSKEDLENFIHLVEKWDLNLATDSFSEDVRILFSALHRAVTEIAEVAKKNQQRDVTSHLIDVWLKATRAMIIETEWHCNGYLPTFDEYMTNGFASFSADPIVHAATYFVGPLISEEAVNGAEFHSLSKTLGIIGRLLNDIASFERESTEEKMNGLALHMAHAADSSKEMVIEELMEIVELRRMELLQLVLRKETEVPNACKQVFWKMSKNIHTFYQHGVDLTTSIEVLNLADSILHEPISFD